MTIFGNRQEDTPDENPRIELGDLARDKITGFEGIVTGRYEYLNGCVQWGIERLGDDGKPVSFAFDDQQVAVVRKQAFQAEQAATPQQAPAAAVGGPSRVAPTWT